MVLINLFFVLINGWLMIFFIDEDNPMLVAINFLAVVLNLLPVVNKLLI